MPYKIAILYIATGKYDIFWQSFYESAMKYFCVAHERHFFVFTDSDAICESANIHKIYQENLGWPGNTLQRYAMFWRINESLREFDYIFFFNANCEFKAFVNDEFLPNFSDENQQLLVVKHPGFYDKNPSDFTYDRNPKSLAYIQHGGGDLYVFGAVNGGKAEAFLRLIWQLKENIQSDLNRGVIALWHDESHLNRYILDRNDLKIMSPAYAMPQDWDLPFPCKILIRDKKYFGGHEFLRGIQAKDEKSKFSDKICGKKIFKKIAKFFKKLKAKI